MWKVFSASAQGQWYFSKGKNNQDAVDCFADENLAVCVICDGCGSSSNSEVIARLSVGFFVRTVRRLIGDGVSLEKLPQILFAEYLEYLKWKVETEFLNTTEQIDLFIRDYLLCTINGVVAYDDKVLLFSCGDGANYLNSSIYQIFISPGNRPTYAAYNLYRQYGFVQEGTKALKDEKGNETGIPEGFATTLLVAKDINLVGIASDGISDLPNLFDELRLHATSQLSLNLCMNRIAMVRGEIMDNVTVAFFVKTGGG